MNCHFTSVDEAIASIIQVGRGCFLSKRDMKSAYHQCPVRVEDFELLGFQFENFFYASTCLPFGLRSSAAIHGRYSRVLEFVATREFNVRHVSHFADDFLVISTDRITALSDIERFEMAATELDITVNKEKDVGPCTQITFLGVVLDTIEWKASIS